MCQIKKGNSIIIVDIFILRKAKLCYYGNIELKK